MYGPIMALRLGPRSNFLKSVARMVLMFSGSHVKIMGSMLIDALSKVCPIFEYHCQYMSSQLCDVIDLT